MPVPIIIVIILSIFVALISNANFQGISNPLFAYYYIQIQFFREHLALIIFIIIILSVLYLYYNRRLGSDLFKKYSKFMQRTVVFWIFGSVLAFVFLFFIALLQMNALSLLTNLTPRVLGVESNYEAINERLTRSSQIPEIVVGSEEENLLPAIAHAQAGRDSFYGSRIIPFIPKFLILPIQQSGQGVAMVGNTLIVSEINSENFQKISPVVGYIFIKDYFPDREIPSYPRVELMDEQEYKSYRQEEYKNKLELLDDVTVEMQENIGSIEDTIEQQEELLLDYEQRIEEAKTAREDDYVVCVNEGFYEDGEFIKINSQEECRELHDQTSAEIVQLEQERQDISSSIQENQKRLQNYDEYIKYYNSQKRLTADVSDYVSFEFAAFEPPDLIRISVSSHTSPQSVADYLELLVHEYLHYATYNEDGNRFESSFFTEGLTEYFARKIIKKAMGVETNLGYPANVKIIDKMSKRIADQDLADIYFATDQDELERKLDQVFGQGFYERNVITLETVHYSADAERILGLANDVMNEMGGEPLSVDDLKTTRSVYK